MLHAQIIILLLSCISLKLSAESVIDTLHITRGNLENMENNSLRILNFNATDTFELSPYVIHLSQSDDLTLYIANHDSLSHEIKFSGSSTDESIVIPQGQIGTVTIQSNEMDVIKVLDSDPMYKYQGLTTMIVIDNLDSGEMPFYWNLKEVHVGLLKDYLANLDDAEQDYTPEYFTVNNQSYPHLLKDPTAFVKGSVGETLTIYMYNSGMLHHNFHLHGYHATIAFSSDHPNYVGRSKDSVPIDVDQLLVLKIVPHQAGLFPMHNHNLGATVGTNQYPNNTGITICGVADAPEGTNIYPYGMVTRIEVKP